jgi:hypothetical protein
MTPTPVNDSTGENKPTSGSTPLAPEGGSTQSPRRRLRTRPSAAGAQAQNQKGVIIATLITALATVAVSFVGIVPQLRNSDARKFGAELSDVTQRFNSTIDDLKKKIAINEKKMGVHGTVFTDPRHRRTLSGVEVYLLPEGNNLFTSKTDDGGKFILPDVPDGTYSLIVRDPSSGKSGKGLLDDAENEVTVNGASIQYHLRR